MPGDFNVPTPIAVGGKLIVATENNGTRLYEFAAGGRIKTSPAAEYSGLAPDTSTPACSASGYSAPAIRSVASTRRPSCMSLWTGEDEVFANHTSFIAAPGRLLVTTNHGELLLINASAERLEIVSRLRVFPPGSEVLSHPALVGGKIYLRDMEKIECVDLDGP